MKRRALLLTALCFPAVAAATPTDYQDLQPHAENDTTQAHSAFTEGEVRKIDKEQGKITLRHAPIIPLDMPAMTMVFKVINPAVIGHFKPGDKVRFAAERQQGEIVVTRIEPAP